jgi:hypothetical protein
MVDSLSITKTWESLTEVTVVGFLLVTRIWGCVLGLWHKYKSCDNILASLRGGLSRSPQ